MNELPYVLAAESELPMPMEYVGWSVMALSLLVTIAWLAYFYR